MKFFDELTPREKFEGETKFNKNLRNAIAWLMVGLVFGWFLLELIDFIQFLFS